MRSLAAITLALALTACGRSGGGDYAPAGGGSTAGGSTGGGSGGGPSYGTVTESGAGLSVTASYPGPYNLFVSGTYMHVQTEPGSQVHNVTGTGDGHTVVIYGTMDGTWNPQGNNNTLSLGLTAPEPPVVTTGTGNVITHRTSG